MTPIAPFRNDVQALRGLAVAMVVIFHAWPALLPGGFVGVDVFFVISGYLISGLLLREIEAAGRVNLPAFYARRLRRLLPAAAVVIAATVVAFALTHSRFEAQALMAPALAAAVYASNLWFALESVDYLGDPVQANPLLHTWSLGVEEQFYLLWPALLLLAAHFGARGARGQSVRAAMGWLTGAVSLASLVAWIALTQTAPSWAFFGLPTRVWEFGAGAAALLLERRAASLGPAPRRAVRIVGLACMLVGATVLADHASLPAVAALWPVAGAFLVVIAGDPAPRGRVLKWAAWPLQRLGDISYSLYLWHWPVLILAADLWPATSRAWAAPAGVALALLLAVLSWRYVENPVRRHPRLQRSPALTLGAALTVVAATVGLVVSSPQAALGGGDLAARRKAEFAIRDRPALYERGCMSWPLGGEPPDCEFGDPAAPVTVVLFGDSHAAQWFPALEALGRERRWRIVVFVMPACPVATVEPFDPKLNRPYHECTRWRERVMVRLAELRPTLVVAANASSYAPFVGAPDAQALEDWQRGLKLSLARLTAAAGHVMVLRDTPLPGFHVPRCVARDRTVCSYMADTPPRRRAFTVEKAAAAERERVTLVDLTPEICPAATCEVERQGVVVFHDAQHLSASFARTLAGALWMRLPAVTRQALTP